MSQPLVSILVPVYHVEKYIERCAHSVFGQTYGNLEFVFVDDACDDSSIDVLNRVLHDYPEHSRHVSIIRHRQNRGLAAARNTAVAASRGEFVFHVDSDDWVEANAVELLVEKQRATDADIVSAKAYDYNDGVTTEYPDGGGALDKESFLTALLTYKVSTTIWRRLIRRSLYTDNGIVCDERGSAAEDFQVFPRLVYYADRVSGIGDRIYYHDRSNRESISNNVWKDVRIQIEGLMSVKVIVSFFSDKGQHLRNIVEGMDVRNIHYRMMNNVVHRYKEGYEVFLKYMRASDPRFWKLVRWDKPWVRSLESNYYSVLLMQKSEEALARLNLINNGKRFFFHD